MTAAPVVRLAPTIEAAIVELWPRRRQQELLLDLGERKDWTEADRRRAVETLAAWLVSEVGLPDVLPAACHRSVGGLPGVASSGEAVGGVGRRSVALAAVAGVAPKTLANSLSGGLRTERPDHRWLRLVARIEAGEADSDALVFHRRSPVVVTRALARLADPALDAGDALLLLSLVALWQRRRPTAEARAARGSVQPRRVVPKPVAALIQETLLPGQLRPLVEHALNIGGAPGSALAAVALDAALTEAHLAPHRARRTDSVGSGEAWLGRVEGELARPEVGRLLGPEEREVFSWRVARMRAYAAGRPGPSGAPPAHPYVELALAIDRQRAGGDGDRRFDPWTPGYFMLLPQARRLGLLEVG